MNRYKARQTGIKALKYVGKFVVNTIADSFSGIRSISSSKPSYSRASQPRLPSIPKTKSFKIPKMKSPIIKDFHMPNLPNNIRRKLNEEAVSSGKEPRW